MDQADAARLDRWLMRSLLWRETGTRPGGSRPLRTRTCGRHSVHPAGEVGVRRTAEDVVGFAGLASCGSVWLCPVCNSKIQARRRLEVGVALSVTLQEGAPGGAAFGAYTVRHRLGEDGDALWRRLSYCWQAVARDKMVRRVREDLGVTGIIRAAEVTYGAHGWHPHLHPVILTSRPLGQIDVDRLHGVQMGAWVRAAERVGLSAPSEDAQHLHVLTGDRVGEEMGRYFTKATYEMTSTQTKSQSRATGSLTPWDLLRLVAQGDADALDLWHEWERISYGKRALTWSRGLRRAVGLDAEASDEEIAAEEVGTRDDTVLTITEWKPFRENVRLGPDLLRVLAREGTDRAVQLLDEAGVEYRRH